MRSVLDWPAGAYRLARKAVQLDPNLPDAHAVLGQAFGRRREHESAIAEFERSMHKPLDGFNGTRRLTGVHKHLSETPIREIGIERLRIARGAAAFRRDRTP